MHRLVLWKALLAFVAFASTGECNILQHIGHPKIAYPNVYRDESISQDYFGTEVFDPYQWMEDLSTPENVAKVKKFVDDQNNATIPYVEQFEHRDNLRERLSSLWDYPKYDVIMHHGKHYFQFANKGVQNQNVLYIQDSLKEPTNRAVFLDPNTLSADGTLALTTTRAFSASGEIFAYGLSQSGSDWLTVHFKNVSSGDDLPTDKLSLVKFTDLAWKGDEGIFYGHYPGFEGDPVGSDPGSNINQTISFHKIGTKQEDDQIVFQFRENPERIIASGMATSKDGDVLVITPEAADGDGGYGDQSVYCVKIENENPENWETIEVVKVYDAKYKYITNNGSIFYFLTNKDAPKNRIVGINIANLTEPWTTLVPEDDKNVMNWAAPINQNFLVINYLEDVKSKLDLHHIDGTFIKNLPIDIGSIESYAGKQNDELFFVKFVSFLVPNRVYLLSLTNSIATTDIELQTYEDVRISGFDSSNFNVSQVKYPSKDGTAIPMFIVHGNDLSRNSDNPAMIYGYGGFNIDVLPSFAIQRIVFMQNFKGVVAITNLRGGGEYGVKWHEGGSLQNKQNVFDDFQAAAEYLIENKYTTPKKVIIEGRSNGGLLVGACVNQRPELYGAAIASVGVMDMLRYHLFTIGGSWQSEYGSPDDIHFFPTIYGYSPLHNIRVPTNESVQYPAVLVTTSDHDDRVVPAHSYKYTAQLQYVFNNVNVTQQTNPLLLRVETEAGHGAGKPTSKQIEEQVDIFSFIGHSLNLPYYKQNTGSDNNASERLARFSSIFLVFIAMLSSIVK